MNGLKNTPRERFDKLVRGFRRIGDEYVMLERAISAFERYEEGAKNVKKDIEFKQTLGKAVDKEKTVLIKLMDELEEEAV